MPAAGREPRADGILIESKQADEYGRQQAVERGKHAGMQNSLPI
jgi:hypothetical protein